MAIIARFGLKARDISDLSLAAESRHFRNATTDVHVVETKAIVFAHGARRRIVDLSSWYY